jgi:SAM-dependent methyltransferase
MSNWHPDWFNDYPPSVQEAVHAALSDNFEPPVVLTRLFLALGNLEAISCLLSRVETDRRSADDEQGAERAARVRELAYRDPSAFEKMRDILAILHGEPSQQKPADAASIAAAFDAAVELSANASVALYSLGDPALLARATAEVVSFLRQRQLVSPKTRVLEIGCGIGRFAQALASEVASFTGVDVSKQMIGAARERCTGLPHVTFALTSGDDLDDLADASIDLVLAVDSFPYIVATRAGLAELHVGESARVLAPGGSVVIFNYSYQEDFRTSRDRLGHIGAELNLPLVASDPTPLRCWDGSFFHLRKARLLA